MGLDCFSTNTITADKKSMITLQTITGVNLNNKVGVTEETEESESLYVDYLLELKLMQKQLDREYHYN